MVNYKLLTPGPLTTTDTVKREMLADHCTWDDDYKQITQKIRRELLELAHVTEKDYTVVLMQGSGSFGVESVITSVVGDDEKLLIVANGAYGERMVDIAEHARISYALYEEEYDKIPSAGRVVEKLLEEDPGHHPRGHGPLRDHLRHPQRHCLRGRGGEGGRKDHDRGCHVQLWGRGY